MSELSHLDEAGRPRMVDVSAKDDTAREATAAGSVYMSAETLALATTGSGKKGEVLTTARLAGVMGAKRTHELIPLCHPLMLTGIDVDLVPDEARGAIDITATVRTTGKTGVEMEALTAVCVAALTVYDMLKAAQKDMRISDIRLVRKTGGKSGEYSPVEADAGEVVLHAGIRIGCPQEKVEKFIKEDYSYRTYDNASIPEDSVITEEQVRIGNRLSARMGQQGVDHFLRARSCVEEALSRIPPGSSLADAWSEKSRTALADLINCVVGPGVGLARATKVLHKKRPGFIPILDDVLLGYARRSARLAGTPWPNEPGAIAVAATAILRDDILNNRAILEDLAVRCDISPLRILDIFVWAWSGEYAPIWSRSEPVPPGAALRG